MENFDDEIRQAIEMFEKKDARGIDKFLFRYQEMGMGMLFISLYHAIRKVVEKENADEG